METIKIKVQREVKTEEELEIKLPYYSKSPAFYYKVINAEQSVKVCDYELLGLEITVTTARQALSENTTEITAEEFNAQLKKVSKLIKAKFLSCK